VTEIEGLFKVVGTAWKVPGQVAPAPPGVMVTVLAPLWKLIESPVKASPEKVPV
jgi:hypothetical protein